MEPIEKFAVAGAALGALAVALYVHLDGKKLARLNNDPPKGGEAVEAFDRGNPSRPEHPYRLVQKVTPTTIIPANRATMATGMQWDYTWAFPRYDDGAFFFTVSMTHGLLVGLSRGMTDTAGGYVLHLLAPDSDRPGVYNYGISSLMNPNDVRTFAEWKSPTAGGEPPLRQRTYWVRYAPGGRFALGYGSLVGENTIFSTQYPYQTKLHNLPVTGIKFFGFGSSACSSAGRMPITDIQVVSSQLPS